ncbi:S41 family peptidase [Pectinatus haikarae]|uniref:Carboxyl-terminal processing protease n=1 Tax=Pectinatus haikarae TaxID=349096 RepID=A0ABT9Y449_9FIRM|nr:S41 family peptidase [Pectinatus haikarae]MDQ0202524.1 carboxyl-terminal processing protease [Pectinatus haikarae]
MKVNKKFLAALIFIVFIASSLFTVSGLYFLLGFNKYQFADVARLFAAMRLVQTYYVKDIDNDVIINGAIKGMVGSLDDPHSLYLDQNLYKRLMEQTEGSFGGIGVVMQYNKDKQVVSVIAVMKDTPGEKAGLKIGDEIIAVDGVSTKDFSFDQVASHIRGPVDTDVALTIKNSDGQKDITVTRATIKTTTVTHQMMSDNIGYIRIGMFSENTGKEFTDAYQDLQKQNMRGLVLDLRSNPGGLLTSCVEIAKQLVPKGTIVSIVDHNNNKEVYSSDLEGQKYPIVVLIDENSASASEILAGALQDTKAAVLVGTKSYGKGSVQQVIPLGSGTALKLTIAKYYTPSDRSIDGVGIEPDIPVKFDADGNTDNQLNTAIDTLKQKINQQ